MPIYYYIEKNNDHSKSIWISEMIFNNKINISNYI